VYYHITDGSYLFCANVSLVGSNFFFATEVSVEILSSGGLDVIAVLWCWVLVLACVPETEASQFRWFEYWWL